MAFILSIAGKLENKMQFNFREARHQFFALIVLVFAGLLLVSIYSLAKNVQWGFDDHINLQGLAQVSQFDSFLNFVVGGVAGPTGRPVSLLTFLPNYDDWPLNPYGFVMMNLLWHCLNGLLVFLLFSRLLRAARVCSDDENLWLAAVAAVIWAIMPMHASGILMPVQRMNLVSGFFSLLMMVIFVYWRTSQQAVKSMPVVFFVGLLMLAVLVLSVYSKENGAVTVAYIAIIEIVFFGGMATPFSKKIWMFFIFFALVVIPAYLLSEVVAQWETICCGQVYYRDFTHLERLATQPVVLWEYLRMSLAPRITYMGPFHDDHEVYSWGGVVPWVALGGWLGTLMVSFVAFFRGGLIGRLIFFAVAFYLLGHQLESTIVMLELYFEHRNYLPVLGFVLFFVVLFYKLAVEYKQKKIIIGFSVLVLGFYVFSLQQMVSLWGRPLVASEVWFMAHPKSTRAVQTLASQYQFYGFQPAALKVLTKFSADAEGGHVDTAIQALQIACTLEDAKGQSVRMTQIEAQLENLKKPMGIVTGLAALGGSVRDGACAGVGIEDYNRLLNQFLNHPRIEKTKRVRHHIYFELALNSDAAGDKERFIDYMKKSFSDYPSLTLAQKVAAELFSLKKYGDAILWVEFALARAPSGLAGVAWRNSLISLKSAVEDVQDRLREMGVDH